MGEDEEQIKDVGNLDEPSFDYKNELRLETEESKSYN